MLNYGSREGPRTFLPKAVEIFSKSCRASRSYRDFFQKLSSFQKLSRFLPKAVELPETVEISSRSCRDSFQKLSRFLPKAIELLKAVEISSRSCRASKKCRHFFQPIEPKKLKQCYVSKNMHAGKLGITWTRESPIQSGLTVITNRFLKSKFRECYWWSFFLFQNYHKKYLSLRDRTYDKTLQMKAQHVARFFYK